MKWKFASLLMTASNICWGSVLKEGMCFKSTNMPSIVMQVIKIGDSTLSFKSNISGTLLTQYNKIQLEEEFKVGATVEAPCSEFKKPSESSNTSNISELFGYSLEESFSDFQKKMAKNIKVCRDAKFRKLLGMNNGQYLYSKSQIPIKVCELSDKVTIKFADVKSDKILRPVELIKDLKGQKLLLGVIRKKLEEKTKTNLIILDSVSYQNSYLFGKGSVIVKFKEKNYQDDSLTEVEAFEWSRSPSLSALAELADQKLQESEKIKKVKDSEKNNKDFNL